MASLVLIKSEVLKHICMCLPLASVVDQKNRSDFSEWKKRYRNIDAPMSSGMCRTGKIGQDKWVQLPDDIAL